MERGREVHRRDDSAFETPDLSKPLSRRVVKEEVMGCSCQVQDERDGCWDGVRGWVISSAPVLTV